MEKILERLNGKVDSAEIFKQVMHTVPIKFEAGHLKEIESKEREGIALRVIKDGKLGFSTTTSMEKDKIDLLIEKALQTVEKGSKVDYELPGKAEMKEVKIFHQSVDDVTKKEMVESGQKFVDILLDFDDEMMTHASVGGSIVDVHYMNSKGQEFDYRQSSYYAGGYIEKIRGTDMLFASDFQSSCKTDEVDVKEIAENILMKVRYAKENVPMESGKFPVIFTPAGMNVFFVPFRVGLNGRNIALETSPLSDKKEQQIFDSKLNIYANPHVDYNPTSCPFDDEGVPTKRVDFIKNGVLNSFYFDLKYAAMAKTQSTGNGLRGSYKNLPSPKLINMIVQEGETSFEDMVRSIDRGILVDSVLGLGQGNILDGEFSNNLLLGYKIEKGEIIGRVKDVMIAGNIYEVGKKVRAIGNKAYWKGSVCTPYICFEEVNVVGK